VGIPVAARSYRQWFVDRRAPDRRLQVTWHSVERTAVLSMWHGDTCTATFQLPSEDAARLIAHLADGLAELATDASVVQSRDARRESRIASAGRRLRESVRGLTRRAR